CAHIANRDDPAHLQEETLAYLIRQENRAADDAVVNGLSRVLLERCTRYLKSLLRDLPTDWLEEATAKYFLAVDPEPDSDDEDERHREIADHVTPPVDTGLMTEEALRVLEPNERIAFILKAEGWPIEDDDPSVMTISKYFNRTSRAIRYWIAKAEEKLAKWRDGHTETGT
ncbi:MAG TPA: hypothetical protein VGK33_08485, partial [Chloroflexota bacterium]